MGNGNIALSNTINISLQSLPSGLGDFNTNNIYLFSNEKPLSTSPYIWAISADDIINEYGADSVTAKVGTSLFTPSQNLRGGRGQVLVFPFNGTNATSTTLTTTAITEEMLAEFRKVDNGTFTIKIDGGTYQPTGLNFSMVTTVQEVVDVLNNVGLDCNISVVNENQIQFESRRYGVDGSLSLLQTNNIDIYGVNFLNIKGATVKAGTDYVAKIPATSGYTTTEPIEAEQITSLADVTNGVLTVSINSVDTKVESISFSGKSDVAGIAEVLNTALTEHNITVSVVETNKIKFELTTTGVESKIELKATAEAGDAPDIYGVTYLDGETQTMVYGKAEIPAVEATAGYIETVDLDFEKFKVVTKGSFNIVIDGKATTPDGLDFSKVTSIDDVVEVINGASIAGVTVSKEETNKIKFALEATGSTHTINITPIPGLGDIDLYAETFLNGANAVNVTGINSANSTLQDALMQAQEVAYCGGIVSTQICENDAVIANATYIQTTDHVYYEVTQSLNNISELGAEIKSAGLDKTRLIAYSSGGAVGAKQAVGAYATVAQSVNYSGSNTVLTMNLKELTGVTPDSNLTQSIFMLAKQYGVDLYANTEGLSCVYSFDNGYYTDEATTDLWFKKAMEVAGFNYLRQTNTKIPQTEQGMTGLKSAYKQVCIRGVRNGSFAPGTWNGAIPFGNPDDFLRNIEEQGYYIYSLPIAEQAQTEREARIAPLIQIALKRAGAIHSSDVIINIQR